MNEKETEIKYRAVKVSRKSGLENFSQNGKPLAITLFNFWQWSTSDLVNNATRGILAEFIFASALGLAEIYRVEWNAFDLITDDGIKVEVKSAAYLQSWEHAKLSNIQFGIRPTKLLESGSETQQAKRQADIYVFCLLRHQDKETLDPLNLDQWHFYILNSDVLNDMFPTQKSIGLSSLLKAKPLEAGYNELKYCIEKSASK